MADNSVILNEYSCFVPLCVNYMVIVSGLSDVILVSHKVHPYGPLGYTPTALNNTV